MSANDYKQGNSYQVGQTHSGEVDHDSDDLHRYVTDDTPRNPTKQSMSSQAPLNVGGALIVRLLSIAFTNARLSNPSASPSKSLVC